MIEWDCYFHTMYVVLYSFLFYFWFKTSIKIFDIWGDAPVGKTNEGMKCLYEHCQFDSLLNLFIYNDLMTFLIVVHSYIY